MSQRELARLAGISDAYISQLERGLHHPTVGVLQAIAAALKVRVETMLVHAGLVDLPDESGSTSTEEAIMADPRLSTSQKQDLLAVYRALLLEE